MDVYLPGDRPDDRVFLAAAWKTWMVVYDFHGAVFQDYNFATELANLKKPLKIMVGDLAATSEFFCDRTFPAFKKALFRASGFYHICFVTGQLQ